METEAGRISNGKKQARIIYLHSKLSPRKSCFLEYINLSPPLDDRRKNHSLLESHPS